MKYRPATKEDVKEGQTFYKLRGKSNYDLALTIEGHHSAGWKESFLGPKRVKKGGRWERVKYKDETVADQQERIRQSFKIANEQIEKGLYYVST